MCQEKRKHTHKHTHTLAPAPAPVSPPVCQEKRTSTHRHAHSHLPQPLPLRRCVRRREQVSCCLSSAFHPAMQTACSAITCSSRCRTRMPVACCYLRVKVITKSLYTRIHIASNYLWITIVVVCALPLNQSISVCAVTQSYVEFVCWQGSRQ